MNYNQPVKKTVASLEAELQKTEMEWAGVQRMLAFVLKEIGKPVHVSKATLDDDIAPNIGIVVEEHDEGFTFYLGEAE